MKFRIPLFIFCILASLSNSFSKIHTIPVPASELNTAAQRADLPYVFDSKAYIVAQSDHLISEGYTQYLGDGNYLYVTDASSLKTVKVNIGYLDPLYKFMPDVDLNGNAASLPVVLVYSKETNTQKIKDALSKFNISDVEWNENFNRIKLTATKTDLTEIARLPFILVISKNYVHKNSLIYEGMTMNRVTEVQNNTPYGFNLKGEGTHVGIWDDGAIGVHMNLSPSRVFNIDKEYSFGVYLTHPTYVAGCVGMSPAFFEIFKGPAYASNIYSWDYYNDIIQEIRDGIGTYALNVTNHSYNLGNTTCYFSGIYVPDAAEMDKVAYDNPKVVHVVAVGNTASTCIDMYNSVDIGYQGSKNTITVGWLFTSEALVENSGRGPTTDGRLKPELVTKGFNVQTTAPNNNFGIGFGSSFSAPQVAGISALLQQKYKQQFGSYPNASLVKAVLCNTAHDLGNAGPDYAYGFGRPDALKAVQTIAGNQFFEGSVSTGEAASHTFTVPPGTCQLAVTTNWTDKEGFPYADVVLVNDLDLKIVTPAGDTVLPWKLDPVNYTKLAKRGVDHLNNTEQVTISNPAPGTYTAVIKGTNIPVGPQAYSVTYFNQNGGIDVTYPDGGELLDAGGSYTIKWNHCGSDTLVNIEYTIDGGVNWNLIASNVDARKEYYNSWSVPLVTSNICKVRLNYNGIIDSSNAYFSIGQQVNYGTITAQVCDRTVRMSWSAVSGATAYKVYLYNNDSWILQGQTNGTTFTINNLTNGKSYLYSVSCIKGGVESNHSLANLVTPTPVACSSTNDAGVYLLYAPQIGRVNTNLQLSSNQKLTFIIKNYGSNSITNFNVKYSINGGPIRSQLLTDVLTAGDTSLLQFTTTDNLSNIGSYTVKSWTELPGETNFGNDTNTFTIRYLSNPQLTLPFVENFEAVASTMTTLGYGVNGTDYADYLVEPGGRARTDEGNLYSVSGLKGLTLDNYREISAAESNYIFTLNLTKYVDSTVYLDFSFLDRGEPDGNDKIYARGRDDKTWIEVYDLFSNGNGSIGEYKSVKEINLYRFLKILNNQSFSASSQFKITVKTSHKANDPFSSGGYSFDDFKVYTANNDVALISSSIQHISCLSSFQPLPLTLLIRNNSKDTVKNLSVYYSVNNGPAVNEVLSVNINPYDTLSYTFNTKVNVPAPGTYNITAWINRPADNYRLNDSLTSISTLVLPSVSTFPYYNDFETAPTLAADGVNSSWVWGSPSKFFTRHAAQGSKCWANSLFGNYNYGEDSYLYLGCYDFSALSSDPLFAFNQLQNITTDNDTVYAESSADGVNWKRLGCAGCGENWYNNDPGKDYWDQQLYPWQVADLQIHRDSLDDPSHTIIRLRLQSDIAGSGEGFPIDDLHVYTDIREIAVTDSFYTSATSTGSGWISFYNDGKTIVELNDDGKNLGEVSLGYNARTPGNSPAFLDKRVFPRNWVIQAQNPQNGNFKIRFYVTNDEYLDFVDADDSCYSMGDIGMLRYYGLNVNLDFVDNHVRSFYKYFTPDDIQFYPVKGGYYVEMTTDTLGEFYLEGNKVDPDAIPATNLVNFSVVPLNDDAYLQWQTTTEFNSNSFVVQYSFDGINFINVDTLPAANNSNILLDYNFIHEVNATNAVFYYRIKVVDNTGKFFYSLIDSVRFGSATPVINHTQSINCFISSYDVIVNNNHKLDGEYTARLLRPDGAVVFSRNMVFTDGWNALGVKQFNALAKGAYLLELYNARERYYSKLVKLQ